MKTLRNSSILTLAVVALALLVATPVANADTIVSYTSTVPLTTTNYDINATPSIPLFNPSLGTLNSVEIAISGTGTMVVTFQNTSSSSEKVNAAGFSYLTLDSQLAGGNTAISNLLESYDSDSGFFAELTGSYPTQYTVAKGGIKVFPSFDLTGSYSDTFTGADLADFTGIGNYNLDFDTSSGTIMTVNGTNYLATFVSPVGASVTVTYDYSPPVIPEPGTLTLFGTGLLGLAGMLRYKFMKSR